MSSRWTFEKAAPFLVSTLEQRLDSRLKAEAYVAILQRFRNYVSMQLPLVAALAPSDPELASLERDIQEGFDDILSLIAVTRG
jgi:hypothetical protein